MVWLFVLACNGLQAPKQAPTQDCHSLGDYALISTCVLAAIESTSLRESDSYLCDILKDSDRDECHFRVAERTDTPALCARAGEFEGNCRMHVFSQRFHKWLDTKLPLQEIALQAPSFISDVGLSPADPRPWSAIWRSVLGANPPLDRSRCKSLLNTMHQDACAHTAIALFQDQLTRAWTQGLDLCEGDLPPHIAPVPDPILEETLALRRTQNLCTQSPLPPPPGSSLPGTPKENP